MEFFFTSESILTLKTYMLTYAHMHVFNTKENGYHFYARYSKHQYNYVSLYREIGDREKHIKFFSSLELVCVHVLFFFIF